MELHAGSSVLSSVFGKTPGQHTMFYVYEVPRPQNDQAISVMSRHDEDFPDPSDNMNFQDNLDTDIDFVDDALLNTAPHNAIEQQLLRGDVVGLALMSGAILWSAMGAFG